MSGARYMVLSAFWFGVMSAFVKLAKNRGLPSDEIVLARAIISLALSYWLLKRAGKSVWGTHRRLLLLRGAIGCCALHCVYYGFGHLPLTEATVFQYMHPIFTAVLAALLLGERVSLRLAATIAAGAAGVVLVARPAFLFGGSAAPLPPLAVGVALLGAFFSACAYTVVRRLAGREDPLTIVFYFPLVTVPASLPSVASHFVMPSGWDWLILLGVGIATQAGQVYLTRGLEREPAARAGALSYLQVVFAAGWGVFFGDIPVAWTAVGAGLIMASAYVNIRRSKGANTVSRGRE